MLHSKPQKKRALPRTSNPDKIQNFSHLIENCSFYKQQGRTAEVQQLLVAYVSKQSKLCENAPGYDTNILEAFELDLPTAQELFLLCIEYSNRLTVQSTFSQAQVLIELALLLSKYMSKRLQSCLLSNVCCFYERKNDLQMARLYYDAASKLQEESQDGAQVDQLTAKVNAAIDLNNLSVVELRSKNYPAALKAAKQALGQIEQMMLGQIQQSGSSQALVSNQVFMDNLHVLMVIE